MFAASRRMVNRLLRRSRLIDRISELEQAEQNLLAELASARETLQAHPRPRPESGPTIFLVTIPKSGSVYLSNTFSKGLGYDPWVVSPGCFPRDLADWEKVRIAAAGGAVVQSHLDASPVNLQILSHFLPRIQVHLRDPRQAVLSMLHHLVRLWKSHRDPALLLTVQPAPAAEFFAQPMPDQLDWMLEHYLPGCIQWIGEWLDLADGRTTGPNVLVGSFEQFIQNEDAYLNRSLEFFQIARGRFVKPPRDDSMMAHFRQGTADEWRRVYNEAQQARAAAAIPADWKDRFNWRD